MRQSFAPTLRAPRGVSRRGVRALALLAAVAIAQVPPAPAHAATAVTIGEKYSDGLDSRYSATRVAQAAGAVGYSAKAYTAGRTDDDAFGDGFGASVFGMFGHSNAGVFQVNEGGANDHFLGAGLDTDVVSIDGRVRWWSEYLPFVDIDDMELAIFAGCYTANTDPSYGSWPQIATEKGVDAAVAFKGLVYYPASCTSCNYSGNYFWDRFSYYAQRGDTVATALSKARSDLVAKEGKASGWNTYVVRGSVAAPGSVRIKPSGTGEPLTSQPLGIAPFTIAATTPLTTSEDDGVLTVETVEGVTYRQDIASSQLIDLVAPVATAGAETVAAGETRAVAEDWLRSEVNDFEHFTHVASTDSTHVDGDAVTHHEWRLLVGGNPGPWRIDAEVDRRTGAVVYANVVRTAMPTGGPAAISADDAIATARAVTEPAPGNVSATLDAWDGRWRWTVTIDRGLDGLVPDVEMALIDATTGELINTRAT